MFAANIDDQNLVINVDSYDVLGITYVSLSTLTDHVGGVIRVLPTIVQINLRGNIAFVGVNGTQVVVSEDQFTLREPIVRRGDDALVALRDVRLFFEQAFALSLVSDQNTAETTTPALVGVQDLDDVDDTNLEQPPSSTYPFVAQPPSAVFAVPETPLANEIEVAIIDPGHGGHDTGVVGRNGLSEKALTLAVAKRVRRILKQTTTLKIEMTRSDDRDVALRERLNSAQEQKGDLLISIHAGASFATGARGIEVFKHEKERSYGMLLSSPMAPETGKRLGDNDRGISERFAVAIEEAVVERVGATTYGVRDAPIRLLSDTPIPGVLIEVGFLTNPDEEAQLATASYQLEIAKGIAEGISRVLKKQPGPRWPW